MSQQKISVMLDFKANTQQAKTAMTELQQSLTKLSSGAGLNVNSAGIKQASQAAKDLAYHLSAAYNTDTGKLDLAKLNGSLRQANQDLGTLSTRLLQAGQTGQQSFIQLAKTISMAEAPMFKLSGLAGKLWTSLKNVATWQISSAVLMGFVSSMQEAYQFAQDLNESLTDIRIVTGYSAESMEKFAKEANKAAKALSTTTNEYAKASLIYYQQGLSDKQVKERTDLTIKMANVTGQSAQEVSDQLTAVWNNFDDGSKSLEHYIDVMVALGAATASSSEEISEGLNKFAAVAETVGLSYEYAAAALATVTATTRQSADIVGTAFKTLFARIQDLELGETLDDGTTLGQYSQALAAVGINIKNVNGEVKDMNIILDEMGAKWNTLTKDQQIALAQNVAGVRQYTQLIALMDNWSYFQENLTTSLSSTGALNEQAKTYAEGWEAAQDRVTAALEGIYQNVLDDDFFIGILNTIADIVEGTDEFIEKLGGIEPIIVGLVSLLMSAFAHKIQPALMNVVTTIKTITPKGAAREAEKATEKLQAPINKELARTDLSQSDRTSLQNSKDLIAVKQKLWQEQNKMTAAEKQMAEIELSLLENAQAKQQLIAEEVDKIRQNISSQKEINIATQLGLELKKNSVQQEEQLRAKVEQTKEAYEKQDQIVTKFPGLIEVQKKKIEELEQKKKLTKEGTKAQLEIEHRIAQETAKQIELETTLRQTKNLGLRGQAYEAYERATQQLNDFVNKNSMAKTVVEQVGQAMVQAYQQAGQAAAEAGEQSTRAFLNGQTQIGLGSVSESFFNQNEEVFGAVGTKKAYSKINAKNALSSLRDTLGEETVAAAGATELFNSAATTDNAAQLKELIEQIRAKLKEASIDAKTFEGAIKNLGPSGEEAVTQVQQPLDKLGQEYDELNKKQGELNQRIKEFNPKHLATGTEVFAKLTSGATSALMAFNGLLSLGKQFKENGPPDTLEEWVSTLMTLSFIAPQAFTGIKNLIGSFTTMGGLLKANSVNLAQNNALLATEVVLEQKENGETVKGTAADLYALAVKEAGNEATEESIKQGLEQILVDKGVADQTNKTAMAENLYNAAQQKGTIIGRIKAAADGGNVIAKKALELATKTGIVSINAETGAVVANTVAWYANPIMWIALIIVAVVAAVAALVLMINNLNKSLKADAEAAEKANKSLETQKEIVKELKSAYDALKDSIKSYSDQQSSIDTMIEGTREWKEAVLESNQAVLDLISNYPELREFMSVAANGRMQISEEGLEYLQDKELQKVQQAQAVQLSTQVYANEAQMKANRTALSQTEKADYYNNFEENLGIVLKNSLFQAFGPIGVMIGQATGQYTSLWEAMTRERDSERAFADAVSTLSQEYFDNYGTGFENFAEKVEGLTDISDELKIALCENKDEIMSLIEEEAAVKRQNQLLAEEVARNTLALYRNNPEEDPYSDLINIVAAKGTQKGTESYEQAAMKIGGLGYEGQIQAYEKYLGEGYDVRDENGKLSVWKRGEAGADTEIGEIGLDTIVNTLVSQEAYKYWNENFGDTAAVDAEKAIGDLQEAGIKQRENETRDEFLARLSAIASEFFRAEDSNKAILDLANYLTASELNALSSNGVFNQSRIGQRLGASIDNAEQAITNRRLQETQSSYANRVQDRAERKQSVLTEAEMTPTEFAAYAKGLSGFGAVAEEVALSILDVSSGIGSIGDAWRENADALASGDTTTKEFAKGVAAVQEAMTSWAGVDIGYDWIVNNLEIVQGAINGTSEDLIALFDALQNEKIETFGFSEATKTELNDLTRRLNEAAITSGETGMSIDQNLRDQMQHLLDIGAVTAEELSEILSLQGWQIAVDEDSIDWGKSVLVGVEEYASEIKSQLEDSAFEDEIERYHEINEQLDDMERNLGRISKAKDRAFGKAKIKFIEQEIAQQQLLNETQQEYYDQIATNLKTDRENLDSGFKLDETTGQILNYTEYLEALQEKVNMGSLTEEQYEEIKAAADQYEETLNLLEQQQEVVEDGARELLDLKLEQIDTKVQLEIEINDDSLKYLEYLLKKLDDPIYEAADAIHNIGDQLQKTLNKAAATKEGIKETFAAMLGEGSEEKVEQLMALSPDDLNEDTLKTIFGEDFVFDENTMAKLKEYRDSLYESDEAITQFYESVMEKVNGAFEATNDEAERGIKRIEQLGKTIETYQNVIDLVGKKSLGVSEEQIRSLGRAQVAQAQSNLKATQIQLETNKAMLNSAKEARDAAAVAGDDEAVKYWDQQIKTIQDSVWDLEGQVEAAWTDTLEAIADDFANAVQTATTSFEESMTGIYGTYEKLNAVFDQQSEIRERYLQDYEKLYEFSKLSRELQSSIDQTSSLKGKKALLEIQQDINDLEESGAKVSEYDLKHLRQKYELKLAEIALEEAQNAKSQVRMRRDSEGNWSYVYTADESNIEKAEQNYEDKLHAIYDESQNYIDQMQSLIIQSEQDMINAINALKVSDFATQEEYEAEVARITQYYTGKRQYYLDELNKAIGNSKDVYDNDYSNYKGYTDNKILVEGSWQTTFGDTVYAQTTGYQTMEDSLSAFKDAVALMLPKISQAFGNYATDVKTAFENVGIEFDNFAEEGGPLDTKVTDVTTKLGEIDLAFSDWKTTATKAFAGITAAATEEFTEFSTEITNWKTEIDTLLAKFETLFDYANRDVEIPDAGNPPPEAGNGGAGGNSDDGSEGPGDDDGSGTQTYYGTYTIGNKTYRTKEGYDTAEKAQSAAKSEATNIAQSNLSSSRYTDAMATTQNASAGAAAEYAQISASNVSDYSTTNNADDYSVYDTSSLKSYSLQEFKDQNGKPLYLRSGMIEKFMYNPRTKQFGMVMNSPGSPVRWYSNLSDLQEIARAIFARDLEGAQFVLSGHVTTDPSQISATDAENYVGKSVYWSANLYAESGQGSDKKSTSLAPPNEKDSPWIVNSVNGEAAGRKGWWQITDKNNADTPGYTWWINTQSATPWRVEKFDTGGYTGEWDSSGRLAMLHQKELVLNAQDTENFLAAVDVVRDIANAIDLKALAYKASLRGMTSKIQLDAMKQQLDQNVTIHAEFPNATNHNEIEEAFTQLLTRASQVANRKN